MNLPPILPKKNGFLSRLLHHGKNNDALEKAIVEAIGEDPEHTSAEDQKTAEHQRLLLANVLKLKDQTAFDVMVPRADIVAIDVDASPETVMQLLSSRQYSRLPVYRSTLDDVVGTVHIKDILARLAQGQSFATADLIREVSVVSPAMPVLDLLLMMRSTRKHMVLVVDEYGGIDGLVTINDIVESIVGEIEDEYESGETPKIRDKGDGTYIADGRVDLEDFEDQFGATFSEDDHEESDTLAGLVVCLAGRVPCRGEVITHESGLEFEILDADPRRVSRIRLRNIPNTAPASDAAA